MNVKALKCTSLKVLKATGVFRLVLESEWRRRRLVILCYHGVSQDDEHLWMPSLYLDPARFESRLRILAQGAYNVLPLGEAIERLYQRTLPPRSVVLTFDDGTCDFRRVAWPLLERYHVPATVYLSTYYCHHPQPVVPLFYDYLLWKGRLTYCGGPLPELDGGVAPQDASSRARAVAGLAERMRQQRWSLADKDLYGRKLASSLGVDYAGLVASRILQLMNPAEVAEVAAAGIDVQLHTHRHRTPADRELFLREINDNRRHIREMCGIEATHFCYPSGVHDEALLPWLREGGVRSATTCESGLASRHSEPLLLPRVVDTSSLTEIELESYLCGVGDVIRNRRRRAPRLDLVDQ